jgi:hypothetical protein
MRRCYPRPHAAATVAAALATVTMLIAPGRPAQAQAANSLEALLSGGGPAAPRTLRDLSGGGYQRVRITLTGVKEEGGGGIGGLLGGLLGGEMGGAMGSMMNSAVGGVATAGENVYYTRGQTVVVGPETFLVAYRPRTGTDSGGPANLLLMMKADKPPAPPKPMTAEMPVSFALLNLRAVASFTDVHPFDLQAELAASAAQARAWAELAKKEGGGEAVSAETASPSSGDAPAKPAVKQPSKPQPAPAGKRAAGGGA